MAIGKYRITILLVISWGMKSRESDKELAVKPGNKHIHKDNHILREI